MKKLTLLPLLVLLAPDAHAYLDPASGSMVLQVILGGIAGAAVVIKLYWHKLLGLFGIRRSQSQEMTDAGTGHDEPTA